MECPPVLGGHLMADANIEGTSVSCILDTGSQVSIIAKECISSLKCDMATLEEIPWLRLKGANGLSIPYLGCITLNIKVIGQDIGPVSMLVVEKPPSSSSPCLLGMNVINKCREQLFSQVGDQYLKSDQVRRNKPWRRVLTITHHQEAFRSGKQYAIRLSSARARVKAGHEMIVRGYCHSAQGAKDVLAMVEPGEAGTLPNGIVVARSVVTSKHGLVPIRLANHTERDIYLTRSHQLGVIYSLDEDQILTTREVDLQCVDVETLQVVVNEKEAPLDDVLSSIDINTKGLTTEQIDAVESLLKKHQPVFSESCDDYGRTNLMTHTIPTGDAPPHKEPFRRIPPQLYKDVKIHLQQLLDNDIIRESSSPWASPIVLVKKSDGSIRLCVDYRKLNSKTRNDAFPLPRIDESLDALGQASFFSTLDLASGYWQVEMDESDKTKTAFTTPMGLFEFNRMPFGLSNAPATFQRLMQRCLGDQNFETVLIYLDDILIFSKDFDSHISNLDMVLSRLGAAGLKVKPSKCHILQEQVHYLGHVISAEGVSTDPAKCAVVESWPTPTNVKDVRRFLGFTGYYRRFVKDFSKMAKPLFALVGNPKGRRRKTRHPLPPFVWTGECQQAFDSLRQHLVSAPILAYPDFQQPFKLYTDASGHGLGAVLAQDQNGQERVIAYASRSLRKSEKNDANYSAFKLELLALKWAVTEKFRDYLLGSKVDVFTDHNPLVYLRKADLGATEQRWAARLANFDLSIHYRPGKCNGNADALSRLPGETTQEDDMPRTEEDHNCEEECMAIQADLKSLAVELQDQDPCIAHMTQLLQKGQYPSSEVLQSESRDFKRLLGEWLKLVVVDGHLYRCCFNNKERQDNYQLVVPPSLRRDVFQQAHEDAGHLGADRTLDLVRRDWYWPFMATDVTSWCKQCLSCCTKKSGTHAQRAPLVPIETSYPLELVTMDYLTLHRSVGGFENVLVITDHFTKLAVAAPTRDQTARTTATALWKHFIQVYGFPERFHSDQGANFQSRIISELCTMYGATKSRTSPYHPQGNGLCERFNRTLINMVASLEMEKRTRWHQYLGELVFCYNNTVHRSTGYTPFFLMNGRHGRLPLHLIREGKSHTSELEPTSEWVQDHAERLSFAHEMARKTATQARQRQKDYYDKKAREAPLSVGEKVLVRNRSPANLKKIGPFWDPMPYVVIEKPYNALPVYRIKQEGTGKPEKLVHRNELKPIFFPLGTVNPDEVQSTDREESHKQDEGQTAEDVHTSHSHNDQCHHPPPLIPVWTAPPTSDPASVAPTPCPPSSPPAASPENFDEASDPHVQSPNRVDELPTPQVDLPTLSPLEQSPNVRRSRRCNLGVPPARYSALGCMVEAEERPIILDWDWLKLGISKAREEDYFLARSVRTTEPERHLLS